MKIGGFEFNLFNNNKNSEDKIMRNYNSFVSSLQAKYPNAYIGSGYNALNNLSLSKDTAFYLMKKNVIISAAWKMIADRVGAFGFDLVDPKTGEVVDVTNREAAEIAAKATEFFSVPNLRQYVYRCIGMSIGSGQIFATTDTDGTGEALEGAKIKILDSREVVINHDHYGTIYSYSHAGREVLPPILVADTLVYQNLDDPVYGQSQIESTIIDGLTDLATSERQLVFFKNNAMPNVVYMLDPMAVQTEQQRKDFARKIDEKYGGTGNSNKPMATSVIKDVKILELSHKDLELINQRLFAHKNMGIILGFDLRLLSYMKDTGGSYSEIDALTLNNANNQLGTYAGIVEDAMKQQYTKFIGDMPYEFKLRNDLFKNLKTATETVKLQIEAGLLAPNKGAQILGLPISEDDSMNQHYLPANMAPITGKNAGNSQNNQ